MLNRTTRLFWDAEPLKPREQSVGRKHSSGLLNSSNIVRTRLTRPSGDASHLFGHEHIEDQLLSPTLEAAARSRRLFLCPAPTRRARKWKSAGLPDSRTAHSCYAPRRIHRRSSFPECRDSFAVIWIPKQPARAAESPLRTSAERLRVFRASACRSTCVI